jgi:hypothetical protein
MRQSELQMFEDRNLKVWSAGLKIDLGISHEASRSGPH